MLFDFPEVKLFFSTFEINSSRIPLPGKAIVSSNPLTHKFLKKIQNQAYKVLNSGPILKKLF